MAAVAEGLAALGHEVTALITPGDGAPRQSTVRWVSMPPPLGSSHLRMTRAGAIATLARAIRPDAIIERYHNFGGEAIRSGPVQPAEEFVRQFPEGKIENAVDFPGPDRGFQFPAVIEQADAIAGDFFHLPP